MHTDKASFIRPPVKNATYPSLDICCRRAQEPVAQTHAPGARRQWRRTRRRLGDERVAARRGRRGVRQHISPHTLTLDGGAMNSW